MPKPKKESTPLSLRIDSSIYDRLTEYCDKAGQTKTCAIERAITSYIDEYEKQQERLIR